MIAQEYPEDPEISIDRKDKMLAIDLFNTRRHKELIRLQNLILNNIVTSELSQLKINSFYFEEFQCKACGSVSENSVFGGWKKFLGNAVPEDWEKFVFKFRLMNLCFCDTLEDLLDALELEYPLGGGVTPEFIPLFAARTWS